MQNVLLKTDPVLSGLVMMPGLVLACSGTMQGVHLTCPTLVRAGQAGMPRLPYGNPGTPISAPVGMGRGPGPAPAGSGPAPT